jgi:L-ascorbate metabolism protein UlaG (beta-lactamase superfamily)
MRVFKYIHSCLLLEHAGEKLLFDPGKFSFVEGKVKPENFSGISVVAITHQHPDHVDAEALQRILAHNSASVVANGGVASKLEEEGIEVTVLEEGTRQFGAFTLQAIPAQHEAILSDSLPHNTAFLVNECVLNPGDSFKTPLLAFKGVELLILPIMAPWLTELAAADFARQMQPRQALAAHDGYAKRFFLEQRYTAYRGYLDKLGIRWHASADPGACVEL